MIRRTGLAGLTLACLLGTLAGCSQESTDVTAPAPAATAATEAAGGDAGAGAIRDATADLDGKRIANADSEPGNWLAHGRTYDDNEWLKQKDGKDNDLSGSNILGGSAHGSAIATRTYEQQGQKQRQ